MLKLYLRHGVPFPHISRSFTLFFLCDYQIVNIIEQTNLTFCLNFVLKAERQLFRNVLLAKLFTTMDFKHNTTYHFNRFQPIVTYVSCLNHVYAICHHLELNWNVDFYFSNGCKDLTHTQNIRFIANIMFFYSDYFVIRSMDFINALSQNWYGTEYGATIFHWRQRLLLLVQ